MCVVSKVIDLTNINKINVTLKELQTQNTCTFYVGISNTLRLGSDDSGFAVYHTNKVKLFPDSITSELKTYKNIKLSADVSSYSGNYYVYIGLSSITPTNPNSYDNGTFGYGKALISDISFK